MFAWCDLSSRFVEKARQRRLREEQERQRQREEEERAKGAEVSEISFADLIAKITAPDVGTHSNPNSNSNFNSKILTLVLNYRKLT